jgi:hypothetical protein
MESLSCGHIAYPTASVLEVISSDVPKINVPTLVLAGEFDQLDLIEQHKREAVARISNALILIIKATRHLIPINEPLQLAKEIAIFMGELVLQALLPSFPRHGFKTSKRAFIFATLRAPSPLEYPLHAGWIPMVWMGNGDSDLCRAPTPETTPRQMCSATF